LDRPAAARSTAPAARGQPGKGSFGRFLAVGGTATAIQYALLALFVDGAGWRPALASACAYALAMLVNYEMTRRFTFRGRTGSWRLFGRFLTVQVAGLALNTAVFEAGLRLGLPHYLLAQLVATAVVTVVSWNAYRRWAFRH
jgi:putative flippase GtrA